MTRPVLGAVRVIERDRDLDRTALAAFAGGFGGRVVLPGDAGYDQARVVWNAIFDRYPACIAQCASVPDVVAALRFAREQELTIAVRGGGHSAAGFSTCDGGMVLDLRPIQGVTVDTSTGTTSVGAGAHLSQLDEATQAAGLACPVGVIGHTGVAGLTLGGGIGRLQRRYGLTIDNLLGVELVTADGRLVRADENENGELFWGLRGAGANFGIVTSFRFRLHPVGPAVVQGVVAYPLERAHELAGLFCELAAAAPDELVMSLEFRIATEYPPYPPGLAGRPVVVIEVTYCGPIERADRYLRRLKGLRPMLDTVKPRSYLAVQTRKDEMLTWGHRFYMKNAFFPAITDEVVDVCAAHICDTPGICAVAFMAQGGAMARVEEDATAFTGRSAAFWCGVETVWDEPTQDDAHIAWGRATMTALKPFTGHGHYVNDVIEADDEIVRDIYGDAKYQRLAALKRAWDPDNVFRLNHNINPGPAC
jgi:FAD/FMN-containing dehydrogenase